MTRTKSPFSGVWIFALMFFLSCIGYLLWTEHRAHVIGFLPWLILLLCLLMYLFMRRHHGGHGGSNTGDNGTDREHGHHKNN